MTTSIPEHSTTAGAGPRIAVTVLFVCMGAYATAAQIYFVRELLVMFLGNELCIGIVLAAWFAGIGPGAALGSRLLRKDSRAAACFYIGLTFLCLLPFMLVPAMRLLRLVFSIPAGGMFPPASVVGGTLAVMCPFSFMVGFVFPAACRVFVVQHASAGGEIGWVYSWEAVGSLAGGLLVSLVLIPRTAPLTVFAGGAAAVFSAACTHAVLSRGGFGTRGTLLALLALSSAGMLASGLPAAWDARLIKMRWRSFETGLEYVASRDSRYQNIVLAASREQHALYANGRFVAVYPDDYQAALTAHMLLTQHPSPRRVLLVGGGMTGLLREVLKHPVESLVYVELDAQLLNMISPVLSAPDSSALHDSRVTIVHADGRRYVKQTGRTFDLIVIQTPDPSTALLNRFYTIDFLREADAILSDRGMIVLALSSSANYVSPEMADYNGSLWVALNAVFPCVMVVPGDRNLYFGAHRNGLFTRDYRELVRRYTGRDIHSEYFSPLLFQWLVQKERIAFFESALSDNRTCRLNTDLHPLTFYFNLVLWEMIAAEGHGMGVLKALQGRRVWYALMAVCMMGGLAFVVAAARRPRRWVRGSCLWLIATSGCTGMALEVIFILAFQGFYGYIYEKIGIIVALFMAGLAAGGLLMRRYILLGRWSTVQALVCLEIMLCASAAAVPFALSAGDGGGSAFLSPEFLYCALVGWAGFLVGCEFPLVCHVIIGTGTRHSNAAGWVDAADHVGACCGAFFTGALLVPLWGIHSTCYYLALLKISSMLLLVIGRTRLHNGWA